MDGLGFLGFARAQQPPDVGCALIAVVGATAYMQHATRYDDLAERGSGTIQIAQHSTALQQDSTLKTTQAAVTAAQRQADALEARPSMRH